MMLSGVKEMATTFFLLRTRGTNYLTASTYESATRSHMRLSAREFSRFGFGLLNHQLVFYLWL